MSFKVPGGGEGLGAYFSNPIQDTGGLGKVFGNMKKPAIDKGEKDAEEIVDGLIDLCVVAIGTLDAFGIDAYKAWDEVHQANMSKEVGVKKERPNPLGLPDLVKPEGWINPSHGGNHGLLNNI
jgi:predicted HAD superfamily Cof-like phosphohydrolase